MDSFRKITMAKKKFSIDQGRGSRVVDLVSFDQGRAVDLGRVSKSLGFDELNEIFMRKMDLATRAHIQLFSAWLENGNLNLNESVSESQIQGLDDLNEIFKDDIDTAMRSHVSRLSTLLKNRTSRKYYEAEVIQTSVVEVVALRRVMPYSIQYTNDWVGKHRFLVEKSLGCQSDFFIFDLKENVAQQVGGILFNHVIQGGLTFVEKTQTAYALGRPFFRPHLSQSKVIPKNLQGLEHSGASSLNLSDNMNVCNWKTFDDTFPPPQLSPLQCTSFGETLFCIFPPRHQHKARSLGLFYDTSSNISGWRPIPLPPDDMFPSHGPLIHDPINGRLLCVFNEASSIYAYYPSNPDRPWDLVVDNVSFYPLMPATSVVNDVLFFYGEYQPRGGFEIMAYDIQNKCSLEVSWSSQIPDLFRFRDSAFLYLGGNLLCLYTTISRDAIRKCFVNFQPTSSQGATRSRFSDFHPTSSQGDTPKQFVDFQPIQARRISPGEVRLDPLSVHHITCHGLSTLVSCVPI